jgi:hypothetical protein
MKSWMIALRAGVLGTTLLAPTVVKAAGLRGSPSSMKSQHSIAVEEDLAFLRNASDVRELASEGDLVKVEGNADFSLSDVSFPYARPEVKLFIERLSEQHYADLGEPLVVTSLTRPISLQPKNAHELSVHPAGMAVDFRVPSDSRSRKWLEKALLGLEKSGVLDVTREHYPSHYHVAVYPAEYLAYVEKKAPGELAARKEKERNEALLAHAADSAKAADSAADSVATAKESEVVSNRRTSATIALTLLVAISASSMLLLRKPR